MLDADITAFNGVFTKTLNQGVDRNGELPIRE
jgi:hypothetical protein